MCILNGRAYNNNVLYTIVDPKLNNASGFTLSRAPLNG